MVKVNFVHARAVVGKGLDGDRGVLGLARQFLDASLGCCHGLAVAQDRHLHSLLRTGPFCFVVTGGSTVLPTLALSPKSKLPEFTSFANAPRLRNSAMDTSSPKYLIDCIVFLSLILTQRVRCGARLAIRLAAPVA